MLNSNRPNGKFLRNAFLEEDANGDLFFTFSPEELKILGVKPGDMIDFKIIDGAVHLSKVKTKPKAKKKARPKDGKPKRSVRGKRNG